MPIMSWSDSYTVNAPELDAQHEILFKLINDLYDCMKLGQGQQVLGRTLDALVSYIVVHFSDEENMLARIKYPDLPEHQLEHDDFVRKVNEFQTDFENGRAVMTSQVLGFLKDWLVNHIMKSDKKYAGFVKRYLLT